MQREATKAPAHIKPYANEFMSLVCDLSPENLSCDGECSRSETRRRYNKIMTRWRELERIVGQTVDESDVYHWFGYGY